MLPESLVDDKFFMDALMRVQECLCEELGRAGGPALCFCGVSLGQPPFGLMNCADGKACGVAWVSPLQVFPSNNFPAPLDGVGTVGCGDNLVMQLELGVARCAPRPRRGEATLDPQDTYEAMRIHLSDMQAMRRALLCCFPQGEFRHWQVTVEQWMPLDPLAGATGGTWTGYIGR